MIGRRFRPAFPDEAAILTGLGARWLGERPQRRLARLGGVRGEFSGSSLVALVLTLQRTSLFHVVDGTSPRLASFSVLYDYQSNFRQRSGHPTKMPRTVREI